MIILKALLVALSTFRSTSGTSTTELNDTEDREMTSVPHVNMSVNRLSGNLSEGSYTIKPSLSRVLDFYNTELLALSWERIKKDLSQGCQKDVEAYIEGLSKAKTWAMKSESISIFVNYILNKNYFLTR